jgi:hypothetical protein
MKDHDLALLESARKTLNASASTLQDYVTASTIVENFKRNAEEKLRTEEAARLRILSQGGSAASLREELHKTDKQIADLRIEVDIAAATSAALLNRIASMKEAEAVRQQRAFYDKAVELHTDAVASIDPTIEQLTAIARPFVRKVALADLAVMRANKDLPPGCAPLPMVDASRRVENPEPVVRELRRGRYYVEEASGRVLGPEGQVSASPRKDGNFDVALPGGATAGALHTAAVLREMVELETTEYPGAAWPELLAASLRIPGAKFGDPDGWSINTDGNPPWPDQILARLDQLEKHAPAEPPQPRVSVKLISAERWDAEHPSL